MSEENQTESFCCTCNSKQIVAYESFDSGGHHEKCSRCGSDMGQVPFNYSRYRLCGCDEPLIHNEYENTEVQEDIVYVNFKAKCINCKKEWKWRDWVSYDKLPEEVMMLHEEDEKS